MSNPSIFILCGLPMCGNTTILNSLSYILEAGIVSGGLRPVATKLGIESKGEEFVKFLNSELAELIDPINDKLLTQAAKLCFENYKICVLESKPGARFRRFKSDLNGDSELENLDFGENSKAIFLFSSDKVIENRAITNGRIEDLPKQKQRMIDDNNRYFKNYQFKPYDYNSWSHYVDIPINNEDLSVAQTLKVVFTYCDMKLDNSQMERLNEIDALYEKAQNAKEANVKLVEILKQKELYFNPDWISDNVVRELEEIYGITEDNYQGYFEK